MDPNGESNEIGKSSWYLVRYADGTYRYQRIWDEKNPLTDAQYGLRGCRSIRPSPFPEEAGRVWYFCGFDQTGPAGRRAHRAGVVDLQGDVPSRTRTNDEADPRDDRVFSTSCLLSSLRTRVAASREWFPGNRFFGGRAAADLDRLF